MRQVIVAMMILISLGMSAKAVDRSEIDFACLKNAFLDCDLIHAMVYVESNYRTLKVSDSDKVFVYGPLQVKCETARGLGLIGKCNDLLIPSIGLDYGIKYLVKQMQRYPNILDAIAAYNSGTVYRCKKKCPKGEYVNQRHVDKVIEKYIKLKFDKMVALWHLEKQI